MGDRLHIIYAHIHQGLMSWIPPYWMALEEILDSWFSRHPLPEIALPLVACQAVEGNPEEPTVMRATVAILAGLIGLDLLDDMRLKDHREALWLRVGTERTTHYAHAFQALSGQLWTGLLQNGEVSESVFQAYQHGMMIALAGRDRVLSHHNRSWETYWKTVEMMTATLSGQLAVSGALLAKAEPSTVEACRTFGHHLGLARHILDEYLCLEEAREGRLSWSHAMRLPLLYGLQDEHPDRQELAQIIQRDQQALHQERVREILEAVDAGGYLMWAALNERKRALEAIKSSLSEDGRRLLEAFLMGWFEQIPAFTEIEEVPLPERKKKEIPREAFDPEALRSGLPALSYQSAGLGLRQHIRHLPLQPNL